MTRRFHQIGLCLLGLACALAACGCKSRGIDFSGCVTPTYRLPSGYSQTYRDRLNAFDSQPVRKEVVNPSLLELPAPVPYAPPAAAPPAPKPGMEWSPSQDRMPFPPAPDDSDKSRKLKKPRGG